MTPDPISANDMVPVRVDPIDIDTVCYGCHDEPASTCVSASACIVVLRLGNRCMAELREALADKVHIGGGSQ